MLCPLFSVGAPLSLVIENLALRKRSLTGVLDVAPNQMFGPARRTTDLDLSSAARKVAGDCSVILELGSEFDHDLCFSTSRRVALPDREGTRIESNLLSKPSVKLCEHTSSDITFLESCIKEEWNRVAQNEAIAHY